MFDGFSTADFDAYLPDKWGSNMFTLPRRKVRDKLDAIGRALTPVLEGAGLRLGAHLSDDHPSLWNNKKVDTQWLFFSRDETALRELADVIDVERTLAATLQDPTPLYRHLFLGAAVRSTDLDVGLWLHHDAWVDRKNLLSLLADPDGRRRFEELRRGLPMEILVGLAGGELASAAEIDGATLEALLRDFDAKKGWIFLGARLPRDSVVGLGADALTHVVHLVERLVPLYAFTAWSRANDAVSIDGVVARRRLEIEAAEAELAQAQLKHAAQRTGQEEERRRLRSEAEERAQAEQVWRDRERAIRRAMARTAAPHESEATAVDPGPATSAADAPEPAPIPAPRTEPTVPAPSPVRAPAREQPRPPREQREHPGKPPARRPEPPPVKISDERKADVRVGDSILVLRGFLKGRTGVVHAVEEKGHLKVAFGSLTARVPREDVEGRGPAPSEDEGRRRGRS